MSTPAERSRAYRDRKRGGAPRQPKPHGTVAAYRRHQRAQEAPCEACKAAHAAYQRDLYRRRKGCWTACTCPDGPTRQKIPEAWKRGSRT